MSQTQFKKILLQAYKDAAKQLEKGNPRGFRIINDALNGTVSLTDSEEEIFQQHIIAGMREDFVEDQENYEGAKNFFKEISGILEEIGKAYESDDIVTLNKLYRKWVLTVNKRWKAYRYLMRPSAKEGKSA